MTTNKERLEDLEANVGTMQGDIQKLSSDVTAKLQIVEHSLQSIADDNRRTADENRAAINRMMALLAGNHDAPTAQREPRRLENNPPIARHVKLDLQRFHGDEAPEWISKVHQYFAYHEIPPQQQVSIAAYHLTGEANEWWQATSKRLGTDAHTTPWGVFESELWKRFGPTKGPHFHEALSKIQQTGSLREYQREFEQLQNRVENWSEDALIGTFLGGLNKSIAAHVRMFSPTTLQDVFNLARLSDEHIQAQKKPFLHRSYNTPPQSNPPSRHPANNVIRDPTPPTTTPPSTAKRLSWDEMKRKRSLGLCFSCDERYAPGHKCKTSQLLLLLGEDADDDDPDEIFHDPAEPEITLHALTGWDSPKTIRVQATINRQLLVALIDSGSTHNFISERAANKLNLKSTPTSAFSVKVADGHPLCCHRVYRQIALHLGEISFSVDLYALPLTGLDVVLGIQWLETLGPTLCDWKAHTMEFQRAGTTHTLLGMQGQRLQQAKWAEVAKEARLGQSLFTIIIIDNTNTASTIPTQIRALLHEFDSVFQPPSSLPPTRDIEHHIVLKEGSDPVNVRPYRYAHFQKAEIEKQVDEMLASGLIQPSSSPFSSPVLLVKKKDGSWRFCTDYRALNAATVKDRFPIPSADDMFDELHGAHVFSKLDLTAGYHQVRVHPPDIPKTAFRTHNGHYEYLVMPFGLCNAPSTFQALMNSVFRVHLRKFVLVFFDDILVYSRTWDEHIQHLRTVLELLRLHQLFVKLKKCDFGKSEIEYLGHIISGDGVKVDQTKIKAMLEWPLPSTITELRGFLGLTGYYRKFVRDYGLIARPLTNLLKKGKFSWGEDAAAAFTKLKQAMTTTPTLGLPDFNSICVYDAREKTVL
ncbi:uncharacterized protein LOC111830637 [Capsella rubella]|uniref:uncharacterized protein LOC111830637 n=1 Tax=Capsella rubella TaxID=81985 RepID=UPI000CD590AF|nr:uncharacterized protein LOC111830637 [Capsella rubella]